jgi:hypothetical protein
VPIAHARECRSATLGKQRRDHGADAVGQASATECGHIRDTLVQFGIIADHAVTEVGGDGTWGDGVDGASARSQFFRKVTSDNFDGALDGRIGALPGRMMRSGPSRPSHAHDLDKYELS